uniref:Osteoclast-stimulating factor 1 n=1 Tax=Plectus sambesii TaxID=2011161 RepID=A0A914XBF7_9BILA
SDELSFSEGDILYVLDSSSTSGWWRARCGKHSGIIPYNYVSEQTESIDYPLHEAAKRGNISFLQECLDNQVSVNSLDKSGSTALYWAAHSGHAEIMKILLSKSTISVSAQNKIGDTALHAAAWKGHANCVELLLQAGAKPSIRNQERKTPIDLATTPEAAALLKRASMTQPPADAGDYGSSDDDED